MFLAIDIGNTTTMIGFFVKGNLEGSFRVASSRAVTTDECGIMIHQLLQFHAGNDNKVRKIGISSVVPTLTQIYISMAEKYFKLTPDILSSETKLPFKNLYDDPKQVGADRLANAAAVRDKYGFPAVVIDFGTATTYDVIDSNGDYAGGMIAPGLWTSASNLFNKASRLFPVKIERPDKFIGTDTADSMKSGIYFSVIAQMEFFIERIKNEMNVDSIKVIATGGYAEQFKDISVIEHIDQPLTLNGLKLIFDS